MAEGYGNIGRGPGVNKTLEAMQNVGQDTALEKQQESKDSLIAFLTGPHNVYRPRTQKKKKTLKTMKDRVKESVKSGEKEERLLPVGMIKDAAGRFQHRNPELRANVLVLLREQIKPDDTTEDILQKLRQFYPDISLADEALEFLLETTEGALHQRVLEAKELINEQHGREITAGRNISEEARTASEKGIGTPTSLRDLYRDITGTPRDSATLFQELSSKYQFEDLLKVAKFLLHSLGSDLKAKGPSIPSGQLHALIKETRSLQAVLGVYRFFKGRMGLMGKMFQKEGLTMPKKLSFEAMAKEFMTLASDRYPTSDKVMQRAVRLGIEDWIAAKIIAFSQLRDAIRQVSLNQVFRSVQHRDELYNAIIEALEELEEELEELLEEKEEEWEDDDEWGDKEDEE